MGMAVLQPARWAEDGHSLKEGEALQRTFASIHSCILREAFVGAQDGGISVRPIAFLHGECAWAGEGHGIL